MELPLVWMFHQTSSYGVAPHVVPLFVVAFRPPQPAIPSTAEPFASVRELFLRKQAFPIPHPGFNGGSFIRGSAEQVKVIGHQNVSAHPPPVCRVPAIDERTVDIFPRQPARTAFRANSQKNDRRLTSVDEGAASARLASDLAFHRTRICETHITINGTDAAPRVPSIRDVGTPSLPAPR